MPRYVPSILISDCFGSVGELTYYHRDGVCYVRKRARPKFSGTVRQMERQSVHLRAIAAWQGLDRETQLEWNACAAGVRPHKPPFGGTGGISGCNLFVSAYHGFASLGDEHIPTPMRWEPFPPFSVEGTDTAAVGDGRLALGFKMHIEDDSDVFRYRLLVRVQLTAQGGGFRPGLLRSFVAEEHSPSGDSVATVIIPAYADIWGLDLKEYTVHCRCQLLDTLTGYRDICRRLSFDVLL